MASRKQRGWNVPGFGLPLQWPEMQRRKFQPLLPWNNDTLLLSALDASEQPIYCYTFRELLMLAWIEELTDIPDWQAKIFDPEYVFRWKSAKLITGHDVTRSMVDWCVDEVKYYVGDFNYSRIIPAIDGGVYKSDDCIDVSLKSALHKAASSLRRKATALSSSRKSIVELVDPHLYPYVFGKTKTLRDPIPLRGCITRIGEGEVAKIPPIEDTKQIERSKYVNDMAWSRQFQWLPFDMIWANRGEGGTRITSYINNVHPFLHSSMYRVTETLIDTLIPFFNKALIDLKAPGYQNQRIHLADITRRPVVDRDAGQFQPPEHRAYKRWVDDQGHYHDFIFVDLKREFWNIGLQFILQMRDVDLTVDNPTYEGEEFHVQGQCNERIAATSTCIYSTTNLSTTSPPKLSFRRRVHPEEAILARDSANWTHPPHLSDIYAAKDRSSTIQDLGDLTLSENRVLVYPNVFQTRMNPFSLDDPSKPGHLQVLTLHLIDPNRRAMSTAMVPVQRRDWWAHEIRTTCARFWRLPREVFETVVGMVEGWPFSMEEGERIREEFLEEREEFRVRHTEAMEGYSQWDFGEYKSDSDSENEDQDWDSCGSEGEDGGV